MTSTAASRLAEALRVDDPSTRLQAAMSAGTHPDATYVAVLVERCGIEPDLNVRETLTWALTRHEPSETTPRVIAELSSPFPLARSQALHTLSKIRAEGTWTAITPALIHDEVDEVARTAWRAAAVLTPLEGWAQLASQLVSELGRGDRERRRSLSRAFAMLGPAADAVLETASRHEQLSVRVHARVTQILVDDPELGFDAAEFEAKKSLSSDG